MLGELGKVAQEARVNADVAQSAVADKAGVNISNISRFEAGSLTAPPRKLDAILAAYAELTHLEPSDLWLMAAVALPSGTLAEAATAAREALARRDRDGSQ